jgi:hypothetical protein
MAESGRSVSAAPSELDAMKRSPSAEERTRLAMDAFLSDDVVGAMAASEEVLSS